MLSQKQLRLFLYTNLTQEKSCWKLQKYLAVSRLLPCSAGHLEGCADRLGKVRMGPGAGVLGHSSMWAWGHPGLSGVLEGGVQATERCTHAHTTPVCNVRVPVIDNRNCMSSLATLRFLQVIRLPGLVSKGTWDFI